MQKLAHPDGEVATSLAAATVGVPMGLSSFSTSSMEDVIAQGAGKIDYAIQLYVLQNRSISEALVRRAEGLVLPFSDSELTN
jgi:(S)-2-hydroxy-acid oxidase